MPKIKIKLAYVRYDLIGAQHTFSSSWQAVPAARSWIQWEYCLSCSGEPATDSWNTLQQQGRRPRSPAVSVSSAGRRVAASRVKRPGSHTQRGGTTRSHRVPAALGTPQRCPAAGTRNVLWDAQQRREGSVLVRAGSWWGGRADSLRALAASPEEGSWRGRAAP